MRIDHLIAGQSVAGSDYFETVNPATQEVLAEVASGGEAEVDQAVAYLNQRIAPATVGFFGYPFGHVPDFLAHDYFPRHAARLGLQAAFATRAEPVTPGSDPWNLPRYVCGWHWRSRHTRAPYG